MNLSLCCISKTLSDAGQKFQTMTYTSFCKFSQKEAMEILCSRILHNFQLTHKTIKFCQRSGIRGYRLSSSLAPILTHRAVNMQIKDLPNFELIKSECDAIQQTLKNQPLRVSAHPSEYITLSSQNPECIENSITDLEQHSEIFDLLNLPKDYNSPLNIHVRQDGDPQTIANSVLKVYEKLSNNVRNRLVLENNDNAKGVWGIKNLIKYFYKSCNIPITFDILHHSLLSDGISEKEAFQAAAETWQSFTPLFHYSEGIVENGKITRKHADLPVSIPPNYDSNVYWDVELKHKCQAIFKIKNMSGCDNS